MACSRAKFTFVKAMRNDLYFMLSVYERYVYTSAIQLVATQQFKNFPSYLRKKCRYRKLKPIYLSHIPSSLYLVMYRQRETF